jgi:hypothetical protein
MNKQEAVRNFEENILPRIPPDDKPAKRQAWNDYVDRLQKDGHITPAQADAWDQPKSVK